MNHDSFVMGLIAQENEDHSEEHLLWIVTEYQRWKDAVHESEGMNTTTFEEWIKNRTLDLRREKCRKCMSHCFKQVGLDEFDYCEHDDKYVDDIRYCEVWY